MKKYVLNIDKLYTGQTANALLLSQVDEDFPVLIPSLDERARGIPAFISNWRRTYPDFNPPSSTDIDAINKYIIEFNLDLQTKFKEKGHSELYMMDDTWSAMKPLEENSTTTSEKKHLHCLNGKQEKTNANSSQLNVLFPYKKMSAKSMYVSQLKVQSALDVDDQLERSRGITLQGKVSYEDCVQGVATVGSNLYVMSPNVDLIPGNIHGNGLTIINGYGTPYHFPHTMTLFQPSQDQWDGPNLEKEKFQSGMTNFMEWYKKHNRRTVVKMNDLYGSNVTTLKCLGLGSYEMVLGTYAPTNLVLGDNGGKWVGLNSLTFRRIRQKDVKLGEYSDGKYRIDNGVSGDVGLMFNMYNNFISGQDRIVNIAVPKDMDFNRLKLEFEWEVLKDSGLLGDFEAVVLCNEDEVFWFSPGDTESSAQHDHYSRDIEDTAVEEHEITLVVRIHYQVDFGKRESEKAYREMLKKSGVLLKNIRIVNGVSEDADNLTFGTYVNEPGITEEQHEERANEFWAVSQYRKDLAYQTVVESPLRNILTSGIKCPNNYSSGDLYGDVFVTKSVLDPAYDMNISPMDDDWLLAIGRDYIGMGQCSNQLYLLYKPTNINMGMENNNVVVERRKNEVGGLNYQMVEVVRNVNRFESSIKHKSNVFSVVVENSNLAPDKEVDTS